MAIIIDKNQACINGGYNPNNIVDGEELIFPNSRSCKRYGHDVYNRYPARSSFYIPRAILNNYEPGVNVLDPFMGSGTTAVEASLIGANIYATELDPFARLVAEVSLYRFSETDVRHLSDIFLNIQTTFVSRHGNEGFIPDLYNIRYWFHEEVFEQLLQLKTCIFEDIEVEIYRNFFKIVFADCIKPSSKMERQSTKPYISSKYEKKIKPVSESFEYSFNRILKALLQYESTEIVHINWLGNDATNINDIGEIIDVAITSPPYLNAFDYSQLIKIESSWLGYATDNKIKELRRGQVGHNHRIGTYPSDLIVKDLFKDYQEQIMSSGKSKSENQRIKLVDSCEHYYLDMLQNMHSVYRVLRPGGEYNIVVGNNIVSGVIVPTNEILKEIAAHVGFRVNKEYKYPIKDHRTSIPRDNSQKINYEYVINLVKSL